LVLVVQVAPLGRQEEPVVLILCLVPLPLLVVVAVVDKYLVLKMR
jgi:hypothetical protein